jgi:hypothetical protein
LLSKSFKNLFSKRENTKTLNLALKLSINWCFLLIYFIIIARHHLSIENKFIIPIGSIIS